MAGDWIAWTKGLILKREVLLISRQLKLKPLTVAAMCMLAWEWADAETTDGFMPGMTPDDLDFAVSFRGFANAMRMAGWLRVEDNGLMFPNWQRWNGESAKQRMANTRRQQMRRAVVAANADSADGYAPEDSLP